MGYRCNHSNSAIVYNYVGAPNRVARSTGMTTTAVTVYNIGGGVRLGTRLNDRTEASQLEVPMNNHLIK